MASRVKTSTQPQVAPRPSGLSFPQVHTIRTNPVLSIVGRLRTLRFLASILQLKPTQQLCSTNTIQCGKRPYILKNRKMEFLSILSDEVTQKERQGWGPSTRKHPLERTGKGCEASQDRGTGRRLQHRKPDLPAWLPS